MECLTLGLLLLMFPFCPISDVLLLCICELFKQLDIYISLSIVEPKVLPEVVNLSNEVTEHSITLKWEKPEGEVKGYVVSYKDLATDAEGKEFIVEDGEQTEVKVDGLEPSVDYMVSICVNYGDKKSEGVSLTIQTSKRIYPLLATHYIA